MYTTNAIESLNSGFRRLNRGRTVFPNAMALTKACRNGNGGRTLKRRQP